MVTGQAEDLLKVNDGGKGDSIEMRLREVFPMLLII